MNAVLGIARREVRERRFILAAAVAFALLAMGLQFVPGWPWARDVGETLALMLFLAFPVAAALAVGSSLIGGDLAEGRLSFYFSRPLSASALGAGKLLGGVVLVLGVLLCCLLSLHPSTGIAGAFLRVVVLILLVLMLFAHVITSMYRAGSRLFVLDLGLGAAFVTLFGALVRHLVASGAGRAVLDPFGALSVGLAAATVAMVAASAAQLAYGRADAHRGHIALSAAFWSFAWAGLGALALWGGWVLRVTPAGVGGMGFVFFAAPRGDAIFFQGSSEHGRAGFSPIFLMDGRSGSYVRLAPERMTPPAFAADGRTAVWVAPVILWHAYLTPQHLGGACDFWEQPTAGATNCARLAVARLDRGRPVVEEHPFELPDAARPRALAVDDDGRRVLLAGESSIVVLDASSGTRLAKVVMSDVVAADFLPDGAVRLYRIEPAAQALKTFVVMDWNPKDGSQMERARVPGEARMLMLARRGDLVVVSTGPREKALLDLASGTVRLFPSAAYNFPGRALVLSTRDVALSFGKEIRVVARGGETVASFPLPPQSGLFGLVEPSPGELAVGLWTRSLNERRTILLDAATGRVRREEKGILPAGPHAFWGGFLPLPDPEALASRVFTDLDGALIALEPDGRRREIVAAGE